MNPSLIYPRLILVVLICVVYGNTFLNSFHFDDFTSILEKPWIRGLEKIPQLLNKDALFQRPLVILSFNINYSISEFKVWSYHFFNIGLHSLVTLLIFLFMERALYFIKDFLPKKYYSSLPFFAALVFALHPLSTQSVTYISSRSSIMATMFYLSALILFFDGFKKWQQTGQKGWFYFISSGICFFLGGLSKEIIITLPAMLFLFHFYFISRMTTKAWFLNCAKWIFLLIIPLLTFLGYKQFVVGGLLSNSHAYLKPSTWLLTQTSVVPFEYFRKMLFPFNMNIDIDFPILSNWFEPGNWLGIFLLGGFIFMWIRISNHVSKVDEVGRRCAGFGMAWMLLTLLPTSSFIPLLDVSVEHRTYLPMVGFTFLIAGGFSYLRIWCLENFFSFSLSSRKLINYCIVLILIFFSLGVITRNKYWKDEVSLWSNAKKKSPNLARPYNNVGEAYDKLGKYDEAIAEFKGSLKINPDYFFGLNNLGNIYGKQRKLPEAIDYFKKALKVKPDYSPAHYNLARALHLTGKRQEAAESYRKSIKSNPYFEQAFYNLAYLAMELNLFDEALVNFDKFISMQPNHSKAHFGAGNALMMKGQLDFALSEYRKSAQLDASFALPYLNIANIQIQLKNFPVAIENFERALSINPSMPDVHLKLGMAYHQFQLNIGKALLHLKESLRIDPKQQQAKAILSLIQELENKQHT
jgi:protein O-mannosyl-transferase